MKLTHEPCRCGTGCDGHILRIDDCYLDGIHDSEMTAKLETAVNSHDELVEVLREIHETPMPMTGDVETLKFILRQIDRRAKAVLAKLDK